MGRVLTADTLEWYDLLERRYGCRAPHCLNFAECLFDGVPYCLEHADDLLEWIVAVSEYPAMRSMLPLPFDR